MPARARGSYSDTELSLYSMLIMNEEMRFWKFLILSLRPSLIFVNGRTSRKYMGTQSRVHQLPRCTLHPYAPTRSSEVFNPAFLARCTVSRRGKRITQTSDFIQVAGPSLLLIVLDSILVASPSRTHHWQIIRCRGFT